jgi:hypothetical protein
MNLRPLSIRLIFHQWLTDRQELLVETVSTESQMAKSLERLSQQSAATTDVCSSYIKFQVGACLRETFDYGRSKLAAETSVITATEGAVALLRLYIDEY